MGGAHDIAAVAAVLGDPSRASMLAALMDGRALTATELALEAGVAPSTASSHLARLARAGLVTLARQGRHRYFRLEGAETAGVLERLMGLASLPQRRARTGPADPALRHARICYDHLAGTSAVRLLDRLREGGLIEGEVDLLLAPGGESWAHSLGIDVARLGAGRRPLCRPCLDWSERRDHLAGALGAAVLDLLLARRWARRDPAGRALRLSPRGESFLEHPERGL